MSVSHAGPGPLRRFALCAVSRGAHARLARALRLEPAAGGGMGTAAQCCRRDHRHICALSTVAGSSPAHSLTPFAVLRSGVEIGDDFVLELGNAVFQTQLLLF